MSSPMKVALPKNGLMDSTRSSPRVRRRSSRFDDEAEVDLAEDNDDDEDNNSQMEESLASPAAPSPAASHTTPQAKNDYSKRLTNPLIEEAGLTNVQGFLRLTDGIAFQQADTFPISYYAHMLGLDHVIDESLALNGEDQGIVSAQQLLDRLEQPSTLPEDSVFDAVPERLSTPPDLLFWRTRDGEDDDIKLLEQSNEFDPAYVMLLKGTAVTVPISIPQHTDVLQIPTYRDPNGIKPSVAPIPANAHLILQRVTEVFSKHSEELQEHTVATLEATEYDASLPFHIPSSTSTGWVASDKNGTDTSYRLTYHLEWLQTPTQPCLVIRVTELPCDSAPLLLRIFLMSLVVEQSVCAYAVLPATATDVASYFRLTSTNGGWLCDFRKCSARYACLRYEHQTIATEVPATDPTGQRRRWLAALHEKQKHAPEFLSGGQNSEVEEIRIQYDTETGHTSRSGEKELIPREPRDQLPEFDLLRDFVLPAESEAPAVAQDTLYNEIFARQADLNNLEADVDPCARGLLSSVVRHRLYHESGDGAKRRREVAEVEKECNALVARNKARENEFVKLEMEAVCDICADGEVEPDNSILFCEACNVAVHQFCYIVDEIPQGDYYCLACISLGRDQQRPTVQAQPLPIVCELCPIRDGAFVRTDVPGDTNRWVHVVCAKWHGLQYTNDNLDCVEDCTEVKHYFRRQDIRCELCLGDRGAMVACTGSSNCKKHFHVTCARAIGTMKVTHGENCAGPIEGGWSLSCPTHSGRDTTKPTKRKKKSLRQLIEAGRQFPPEPRPPPVRMPFNQATGPERRDLLALPDYENSLMKELLTKRFYGVPCEICDIVDENIGYVRCTVCRAAFCFACRIDADKINKQFYKCHGCAFKVANSNNDNENPPVTPQCIACNERDGILRPAFANPMNRKQHWKKFPKEKEKSLFGKQLWIHTVCNFWTPNTQFPTESGTVDLSPLVMSHGKGLTSSRPCILCGTSGGIKVKCQYAGCEQPGSGEPSLMHVTCARQAGLEVRHSDEFDSPFYCRCYRHGGNCFNLRAKLEDMIEIERRRAGKQLDRTDDPMTLSEGQRIFFAAIQVMRILGWAWRWAEWWVDYDSSWEPLIEEGQSEESMTKEQLGIVESTRVSRCRDARKCRLAALGAALRNREYDREDDFNRKALDRALRALLHTPSLVGPLKDFEVDFFADWLGRAYRSKSRLLHFGTDKNVVSKTSIYCRHPQDDSPKYEIGTRPLPGSAEQPSSVFDVGIDEVDSFMQVPDSEIPNRDERLAAHASVSKRKRDKRKGTAMSSSEPRKRHRKSEPFNQTKPMSSTGSESFAATRRDRKQSPLFNTPATFRIRERRASLRPAESEPTLMPCRRCKDGHQGGAHCRFLKEHPAPNFDGSEYDPSLHTLTKQAYYEQRSSPAKKRSKASSAFVPKPLTPDLKPCAKCHKNRRGADYCRNRSRHTGKNFDAKEVARPYYGIRKPCRRCALGNLGWAHCRIVAAHWSQCADYTPFVDTGYEPFVMGKSELCKPAESASESEPEQEPASESEPEQESASESEPEQESARGGPEYPFVKKSCTRCNLAKIGWRKCRIVKGHYSRNFDCTPSFPKGMKSCAVCNSNQTEWRVCRIQLCHREQNFDGTPFCVLAQNGELQVVEKAHASKEPETPDDILDPANELVKEEQDGGENLKEEEDLGLKPSAATGLRRRRRPPDRLAPSARITKSCETDSNDDESFDIKPSSRQSRSRRTRSRSSGVKQDYQEAGNVPGITAVTPKEDAKNPVSSIVFQSENEKKVEDNLFETETNGHSGIIDHEAKEQGEHEEQTPIPTSLTKTDESSSSTEPSQLLHDGNRKGNGSVPKREEAATSSAEYVDHDTEELKPPTIRHAHSRPRRSLKGRTFSKARKDPISPARSPSGRRRRAPQYLGAEDYVASIGDPDSKPSVAEAAGARNGRTPRPSRQAILLPEASNSTEDEGHRVEKSEL